MSEAQKEVVPVKESLGNRTEDLAGESKSKQAKAKLLLCVLSCGLPLEDAAQI